MLVVPMSVVVGSVLASDIANRLTFIRRSFNHCCGLHKTYNFR